MSKKVIITDPFQPKITRNDRFAQMSHQEKVIEQKKREIQAKLEAKQKITPTENSKPETPTVSKPIKAPIKKIDIKKSAGFNLFSNDGSFLDTFKQLKDKKLDSKLKSFKAKESYSEQRNIKNSRWSQRRRSPSPKERNLKPRISRFGDKSNNFEPKITINTSFSNTQNNYEAQTQISVSPQNVTGQPLLKNILPPPSVVFPANTQNSGPVIAAPPLLLNVPPPQIVQNPMNNAILLPNSPGNVLVSAPTVNVTIPASGVLTTVTLPPPSVISSQPVTASAPNAAIPVPPPCVPTVELASIPPPNPIQVQNIPQPEPINTLNIPHPAPIQVQNIPTPTSIQLNEIPNPKPLDLLAIPTPNEDKSISDPDFIKNIPPPNKSIPPPTLPETNVNVPPPNTPVQPTCLPPPNIIPPPQTITSQTLPQNLTVQSIAPCQNILVHTIPPPQGVPPQIQTIQSLQTNQTLGVPPPNNFASVAAISVALPVGVVPSSPVTVSNNAIPSLMAQPILPPPGMGVASVNVNCPPPLLPINTSSGGLQGPPPPPPPSFVTQPPPITNQMPPMNVPPPQTAISMIQQQPTPTPVPVGGPYRDMNAGTPDYEAMASLGRMVAQCGPGIEDVVRQRKTQDPNLWFLFHKESAAYQQYQQLIEQFKREMSDTKETNKYKPEDIYEPEMPIDDDTDHRNINCQKQETKLGSQSPKDYDNGPRRKRKSRWGDKDTSVPPPIIMNAAPPNPLPMQQQQPPNNGPVMLSKITRTDPGMIQYAINTYGSTNLTEEEWKKAEDHYKINLLYQDMVKKREELEKLQKAGKNKYDYDSDEDIDGGTWEHKLRDKEMMATQLWAQELTRQAEGKHHIGDFLPPEELKKFMEKTNATKEGRTASFSDYKEFKIKENNIGFKMLQKLGWSEGQGLGSTGSGIVEPINKAMSRDQNQGLGLGDDDNDKEDEYEAYRKRMMLAYRFRPNPLNNPRRPYY